MQKNIKRKILIISVVMILGVLLSYNVLLKSEVKDEKHNLIAMYMQNPKGEYELKTAKEFPVGKYTLNSEKSTCKNGGVVTQNSESKKINLVVSNKEECTLYFDRVFTESEKVLDNLNLTVKDGDPNFNRAATTDETADGLYGMEDDYGTSFYFRGAANNNYVKFGKTANGEDMWWRIIRINGDGSLRIIYDGTIGWPNGTPHLNRVALIEQQWNRVANDAKYVGWMFGGAQGTASTSYEEATRNETSSDVKIAVDNWYVVNIKNTGYGKYLSDEIFCSDRTAYTDMAGTTLGNGYGTLATYYGGYIRIINKKTPILKCPQKNDMFTLKNGASPEVKKSSIEGNKALDYPVGLVTVDEIRIAGGILSFSNNSYYLYKTLNDHNWSLSPFSYEDSWAYLLSVKNDGTISRGIVLYNYVAAPVINIAPEYAMTLIGTGTIADPYILP